MWQQRLIETSRGTFEVFQSGKGQPLCVTHLYSEFSSKGNVFANLFTKYYSVYLVNLRGCGNSTDDTSLYNYSLKDSVRDLEAIREALEFRTWNFAGHSTGGMLALTYAIHYPDRLEQIIAGGLCASSDYMRHPSSIYCIENPNNLRMREIIALLRNPTSTLEERRDANKEWSLMSLCSELSYEKMVSPPNSGKTVSKRLDYFTYQELPTYDLRPQLSKVTLKAFIYGGKHDAQCPYEFAVEAAGLMPNATLKTFEYSNHFPFIEEEEEFQRFVKTTV